MFKNNLINNSTISNLQMLSVALIDEDNTVGSLLSSSELYDSIRSICTNANALIEDVKAHPSRYINISVFGKKWLESYWLYVITINLNKSLPQLLVALRRVCMKHFVSRINSFQQSLWCGFFPSWQPRMWNSRRLKSLKMRRLLVTWSLVDMGKIRLCLKKSGS